MHLADILNCEIDLRVNFSVNVFVALRYVTQWARLISNTPSELRQGYRGSVRCRNVCF